MSVTNGTAQLGPQVVAAEKVAMGSLKGVIGSKLVDEKVAKAVGNQLKNLADAGTPYPEMLITHRKVIKGILDGLGTKIEDEITQRPEGLAKPCPAYLMAHLKTCYLYALDLGLKKGLPLDEACPEEFIAFQRELQHRLLSALNKWVIKAAKSGGLSPVNMFQRREMLELFCSLSPILMDTAYEISTGSRHTGYHHIHNSVYGELKKMSKWIEAGAKTGEIHWAQRYKGDSNELVASGLCSSGDGTVTCFETIKLSAEQREICKTLHAVFDARLGNPGYHAGVNRQKAEELLADAEEGSYLLRDCSLGAEHLVVSIKLSGRVGHELLRNTSHEVDVRRFLIGLLYRSEYDLLKPKPIRKGSQ